MQGSFGKQTQLAITLFLFWLLLTMELTLFNVFLGLVIAIGLSHLSQKYSASKKEELYQLPRLWDLLHFLMHVLLEIYIASVIHIYRILKKDQNPTLFTLKLDIEDPLIITLIANAITMTPGTITIDAEDNTLTILTIRDKPGDIEKIEALVKEKLEPIFIRKFKT